VLKLAVWGLACIASACVEQPTNREVDGPAGVDDAVALVLLEWGDRLGARLDPDQAPPIAWFEGPCLVYDGDDRGAWCIWGRTQWTPLGAEIHLVAWPDAHDSELAHELLHWSLEAVNGHSDGDHSSTRWAQVELVDDALARAGL
jgi:hypothetical protein